jgi:hypothetical protein
MFFTSKKLDNVFIECCQILPKEISFISVEKNANQYSVIFINEEKSDVTYYIKTKFASPKGDTAQSVFDYVMDKISPILDTKNFEEGKEYYYQLPRQKSKYLYLRRGAFIEMRNRDNSSIDSMSFKLNVNKGIVYAIENNEVKNYGIDALLKYCFYFRKQPLFFLNNTYRKIMVDNLVQELIKNKLINPEQGSDIEKYFLK